MSEEVVGMLGGGDILKVQGYAWSVFGSYLSKVGWLLYR